MLFGVFNVVKFFDRTNNVEFFDCFFRKYNLYIVIIELIGDKNNVDRWFLVIIFI